MLLVILECSRVFAVISSWFDWRKDHLNVIHISFVGQPNYAHDAQLAEELVIKDEHVDVSGFNCCFEPLRPTISLSVLPAPTV